MPNVMLALYQVDAFTTELFGGNPAAVVVLIDPLSDETMQSIAAENNLAETAFVRKRQKHYDIQWFTPEVEVALCGHATLAAAKVLFRSFEQELSVLTFESKHSGTLTVSREDELLILDFPADSAAEVPANEALNSAIGATPERLLKGKTDYLMIFPCQADIEALAPDFQALGKVDGRGVICTAPGVEVDFVSRFFGPNVGINEDPVTGSAHTLLTPYWSNRLGKQEMRARQLSKRGGSLDVVLKDDRVLLKGYGVTYLKGAIYI